MPNTRTAPIVTEVYFVEPNPSGGECFRSLGHYRMAVPPRIHETVTIAGAWGTPPQRYRVHEVIHHIPAAPILVGDDDEGGPPSIISECTCVVSQHITTADLDAVVATLCQTARRERAGLDKRPV